LLKIFIFNIYIIVKMAMRLNNKSVSRGFFGDILGAGAQALGGLAGMAGDAVGGLIGSRYGGVGGAIAGQALGGLAGGLVKGGSSALAGGLRGLPFQKGGIIAPLGSMTPYSQFPGSPMIMYKNGGVVMMRPKKGKRKGKGKK
jgi:hypothetical protein